MLTKLRKPRLRAAGVVWVTSLAAFYPHASFASAEEQKTERLKVQLEVPSTRPGCNDVEYFKRLLKRVLAGGRGLEVPEATVSLQITEPKPDAFAYFLRVERRGSLVGEHSDQHEAPTECSKVMHFAADEAAILLFTPLSAPPDPTPQCPKPPKDPDEPPKVPPSGPRGPERPVEAMPPIALSAGFVAFGGIIPGTFGAGGRLAIEIPLRPRLFYRNTINAMFPTTWSTPAVQGAMSQYTAATSWMLIQSTDLCYKTLFWKNCARLNVGTGSTTGVSPDVPKRDSVSVVSAGPHIVVDLPKLGRGEHGNFHFTLEGGPYFNFIAYDIKVNVLTESGITISKTVATPSWISGSVSVAFSGSF